MSRLFVALVEFQMKGDKAIEAAADQIAARMQAFGTIANRVGADLDSKFTAASNLMSKSLDGRLRPALANTSAALSQQIVIINNYGVAFGPVVQRAQALAAVLAELEKRADHMAKTMKLAGLGGGLDAEKKAAAGLNEELDKNEGKLTRMSKQLEGITRFATFGFASLTGIVGGFVRQGLAGTAQGEQLSLAFERLSMQIAAVFLPVVERVTQWIEKLVRWFQSLTGAQQDQLMRWTMTAGVVLFAITAYSKLVAVGGMLVAAFEKMRAAQIGLNLATLNFVGLIGTIVGAIYLMNTAWESASDAVDDFADHVEKKLDEVAVKAKSLGDYLAEWWGNLTDMIGVTKTTYHLASMKDLEEKDKRRRDLTKAGGHIEGIEATWARIAQASVKAGGGESPEERAKRQHEEAQKKRDEIKEAIKENPPVARR